MRRHESGIDESDAALIDRINAGDHDAFDTLYRRHRDWAWRLAWRFTQDREIAADVMQEAFVELAKRFPGFTLTAELRTFLYPVVKHAAIHLQLRARRTPDPDRLAPPAADAGASPETRAALAAALDHLTDPQREVVMMRFIDGLSLNAIAIATGAPLGTVKSRLRLALDALRADPATRALLEP